MAATPGQHPLSIPEPWQSTAAETSISWNAPAMPCESWTELERSIPWPAPASPVTLVMAATPASRLNGPKHLCVSPQGSVIIADTENHRIRVYDPQDRTIKTIAGTGRKGTAGLGGPAKQAELSQPHGVTVGPDGFLYIADSSNNRIVKIEP